MKRDMDLVRDILIKLSECDGALDAEALVDGEHDFQTVAYHFSIMDQAGLIDAAIAKKALGNEYIFAQALAITWEGGDFLSLVGPREVWDEVRSRIRGRLGDAPFDLYQVLAEDVAEKLLYA